jgi:hypothetical protein
MWAGGLFLHWTRDGFPVVFFLKLNRSVKVVCAICMIINALLCCYCCCFLQQHYTIPARWGRFAVLPHVFRRQLLYIISSWLNSRYARVPYLLWVNWLHYAWSWYILYLHQYHGGDGVGLWLISCDIVNMYDAAFPFLCSRPVMKIMTWQSLDADA